MKSPRKIANRYSSLRPFPLLLVAVIGTGSAAEASAQWSISSLGGGFTYYEGEASLEIRPTSNIHKKYNQRGTRRKGWLEVRTRSLFPSPFFLAARTGIGRSGGHFTDSMPEQLVLMPNSNEPVSIGIVRKFDMTVSSLEIEATLGWRSGLGIEIQAGPTVEMRNMTSSMITLSFNNRDARFANPERYPTLDSGRILVIDDGSSISDSYVTSIGAVLRAAYPLPLSGPLAVRLELEGEGHLLTPSSGYKSNWYELSLGAGIGLTYRFDDEDEHEERQKDLIRTPPPTASIDLYAISENGERSQTAIIRSESTTHRRYMRPIPAVGFAPGSADIHPDYIGTEEAENAQITLDSLSHLDPIDLQRHILNLTALRLRSGETARVRLVPGGTDEELGARRAAAIAAYLIDVRGCSPDAVTIAEKSDPGDEAEGRGADDVRIDGLFRNGSDMLNGAWTEIRHVGPRIHVEPEIDAESGVRKWSIAFRHGGREIAGQSSDGLQNGDLNIAMVLADMKEGKTPGPLAVKMVAIDSTGRRAEAEDELQFETAPGSTERTISTWLLTESEVGKVLPTEIEGELTITPALPGAPTTVAERIAAHLRTVTNATIKVEGNRTATSLPPHSPISHHLTNTVLLTISP